MAGNIHRAEFREFWTKVVKPDLWTLRVLAEGLKLSFQDDAWPAPYQEKKNKSAQENMPFVRQQVATWSERKVLKRVEKKPRCVSPLTGAARQVQGDLKNRLCWDGSRHINLLLRKAPVKLSSLEKALDILLPGDYQATYDLSSAYHHIAIHPDYQDLLGIAVPDETTGEDVYYVFTCMPFGLRSRRE